MSKLMIMFWVLDDDNGLRKYVSPWFNYDEQIEEINAWLDEYAKDHRFYQRTRYIKESVKK